ncbi:MAG: hypothetical protein IT244_07995, partial [Bacteroidia bacterium]|nr:hypothetical protein [Bacteroidia bacterium]
MKFVKLTSLAIAGALTFAACKYEEGPKISLRAKRDRVANEWRVEKYTYNDSDRTTSLAQPDSFVDGVQVPTFQLIVDFYRTGSYGVEVVQKTKDANGNELYITNHTQKFDQCCSTAYHSYIENLPSHIQYIMSHGYWTFDRGHTKIQVKPDLSYVGTEVQTQKNTIDWGIVRLHEKELKVKGRDEKNIEWTLHLKPVNSEPYFY